MKVHINHTDLDGAGVFIVTRFYNIEFDNYILTNYEDISDKNGNYVFPSKYQIQPEDDILVTDLMVSPEMYAELKTTNSYQIIDHHSDTKTYISDPNVIFNEKKCATKLYYEWISEGKRVPAILQNFIDIVDTYDNYDDKSPLWNEALNLNRLFYQIQLWDKKGIGKLEWFISSQLRKLTSAANSFYFTEDEMIKIKKARMKEDEVLIKAKIMMKVRTDNANNRFGVVMLDKKISYTMYRILQERKDLAYIIAINSYGGINGKLHIRIQKDNDLDANDFEKFEGHGKAGGGLIGIQEAIDFFGGLRGRKYFEYISSTRTDQNSTYPLRSGLQ